MTKLKAGTYTFKIQDKSNIHDFHLTGPGVNKKTSVGGQGATTWKLTLKKGTYKYVCDPHASFMHGSFTVSVVIGSSSTSSRAMRHARSSSSLTP